ncbi:MAG: hypothetical protein ACI4CT_06370 [Lachnospiraceae bacterium]
MTIGAGGRFKEQIEMVFCNFDLFEFLRQPERADCFALFECLNVAVIERISGRAGCPQVVV